MQLYDNKWKQNNQGKEKPASGVLQNRTETRIQFCD